MENYLLKNKESNQPAIYFEDEVISWSVMYQEVDKYAKQLPNEKRIAIIPTNSVEAYEILLALQQRNIQAVILNRRLSVDELNFQLKDSKVSTLIVDEAFKTNSIQVEKILTYQSLLAQKESNYSQVTEFLDDQIVSIMYTSGTTGTPKGVMQSYANHFSSAKNSQINLGTTNNDVWGLVVPLFHISGYSILMKSLIYDMPIQLFEKFDPTIVNKALINGPTTTISIVPTMLKLLLENLDLTPGIKYGEQFSTALLGGGPIDSLTLKNALDKHISVIQSYGMTETASQIVALDSAHALEKIGSSGRPLSSVELKIKKNADEKYGRILIKSPTLTPGYLNLPNKLDESIEEGWFDTGDLGYLDDEGFLFVKGRSGDMINSGGENIFPEEIENVLVQIPEIDDAAVIGKPDNKWGQVPVAFLILKTQSIDLNLVNQILRSKIAHYKTPKEYVVVDRFPRTASGKIKKFELLKELQKINTDKREKQ